MFKNARLKLTAWYLLIIMFISIAFSLVIYQGLMNEVHRFSRMQKLRIERILPPNPTQPFFADEDLITEIQQRIIFGLGIINIIIFLTSGALGYFLAGKTLRPIQEIMEEQNRFISDASHELRTPLTALKSIFTCYNCDSSICGEERYRKLTSGRTRPHIYYHCTRGKNRICKEGYITEKGLIKLVIEHINKLDEDQIIIPDKLKEGMEDYKKIARDTLYFNTNKLDEDIELTNKDYAKYIMNQGSMTAKRELVKLLPIPKRLHNRQLIA